jgi:sialidase-1
MVTHVDVFTAGSEGYHTYRIPAIETGADGSLIALAEGRKFSRADPGHDDNEIDLVCKRSRDGGRSWGDLTVLDHPGERWSACNPEIVLEGATGCLWEFHCRTKPGRTGANARPGSKDVQAWTSYSDDNGATWSEPRDISDAVLNEREFNAAYFGPGGAIQASDGRLIAPLTRISASGDSSEVVVIYSDDRGAHWRRGDAMPGTQACGEPQVVELADGRIMMDARQDRGTPHRWLAESNDGGRTWSVPRKGQTVTQVCCSVSRYTLASGGSDRNRILWTGPKGPDRNRLVVRISYDEGATFDAERLISDEPAAYSDLAVLHDGAAGVLWERDDYRFISFTRLERDFLEPR